MRIKLLAALALLLPYFLSAQIRPEKFLIGNNKILKGNVTQTKNPLSNSVSEIEIQGDTVWIGTSRGLSYTTDGGENWTNFYGTDAFGTEAIYSLLIYDGIIFAATGHTETGLAGESVPTGSGIRFSTDGGVTWESAPQSTDDPGDSIIVYGINHIRALPVTVPQQNVTYDMAVLNDTLYTASWAGGLRRIPLGKFLANPGTNFERVVLPPDYLDSISPDDTLHFSLQPVAGAFGPEQYLNHVSFSIAVSDSGFIYVGTANGINKSTDGGISWTKFNHQNQSHSISGNFITSLNYDNNTNTVWATTWPAIDAYAFYGVSASSDGGNTWSVFLSGEKGHSFAFKNNGNNSSDVFVTTDNGVFRSSHNGQSWTLPGQIRETGGSLTIETNVFYAAAVQNSSASGATIWLGSANGLAKLEEGAIPWSGTWSVFLASRPLSGSGETSYAMPNPFNPDFGNLRIKFNVNSGGNKVTIRIMNFNMQIIKTVVQNASRDYGEDIETWDGRDENGNVVPNGVYFYTIEENDSFNSYGKIMVIR